MIRYDTGKWNIAFAFSLRGSVFPKAFMWALPSSLVATFLNIWFQTDKELSDTVGAGDVGTSILSGFTFILGFLIVFRSQVAYSRWWEGGALLQKIRGEWFNAFSSLTAFCNTHKMKQHEVDKFQHQLVRLISLLYASALKQLGEDCLDEKVFELINIEGFDEESITYLEASTDRCEIVLQWIQRLIVHANNAEVIKIAPPILARVYNQLGNGIVGLANARKIAEYNIPFCLAQMITFMLLIHWCITPVVCATTVKTPYWAGLLTFVVIFSFWSITYIATELEIPFGSEPNDLPMYEMQKDLNQSLKSLLNDLAREPPAFEFVKEWHSQLNAKEVDLDGPLGRECRLPTQEAEPEEETMSETSPNNDQPSKPKARDHKVPPVLEIERQNHAGAEKKQDAPNSKDARVPASPQGARESSKEASNHVHGGEMAPLGPVVLKAKDVNDLTGVTKVLDVFNEDLLMLSSRIENHLARIVRHLPQLLQPIVPDKKKRGVDGGVGEEDTRETRSGDVVPAERTQLILPHHAQAAHEADSPRPGSIDVVHCCEPGPSLATDDDRPGTSDDRAGAAGDRLGAGDGARPGTAHDRPG